MLSHYMEKLMFAFAMTWGLAVMSIVFWDIIFK